MHLEKPTILKEPVAREPCHITIENIFIKEISQQMYRLRCLNVVQLFWESYSHEAHKG